MRNLLQLDNNLNMQVRLEQNYRTSLKMPETSINHATVQNKQLKGNYHNKHQVQYIISFKYLIL